MPAATTPSALAVLPENYKALLYVLALSFPGQNKTALVRQMRDMGARVSATRAFDAAALGEPRRWCWAADLSVAGAAQFGLATAQ